MTKNFYRSNGAGVFIPDVLNKLSQSGNYSKVCDALEAEKYYPDVVKIHYEVS